jgi:hypothetical protein
MSATPTERDLRLDLFYGLTLWMLFLEYLPPDVTGWMTIRNYGFSDATEAFVFISGYTVAMIYAGAVRQHGFAFAAVTLLKRTWQLYVVHILLFNVYAAELTYAQGNFDNLYREEAGVTDIIETMYVMVLQALRLNVRPANLDVLALSIVLLLCSAPVLWLLQRRPHAVLAASIVLYGAARCFKWNLAAYPSGAWLLNPLSWQLLFVFGAWCACADTSRLAAWARSRPAVAAALAYVVFAFLVMTTFAVSPPSYFPLVAVTAIATAVLLQRYVAPILPKLPRIPATAAWIVVALVAGVAVFVLRVVPAKEVATWIEKSAALSWLIEASHVLGRHYVAAMRASLVFFANDKTYLDGMRLMHFVALMVLALRWVPRDPARLRSPVLRPAIECGEHALPVFVLGLFWVYFAHLLLPLWSFGIPVQALWAVAGIVAMSGLARYISWFELLTPAQFFVARTVALAGRMADEPNLARLDQIADALPLNNLGLLPELAPAREMIAEIARQQRRLDTIQRPFFREPLAHALRTEVENFRRAAQKFRPPLNLAFMDAAARWLGIADRQWRQMQEVVTRTPTPQVFRAGDPVDRDQEAFVPRLGFIADLEGQLMLATGCPGLLLYGRRRTGKSTALKNLPGFLPSEVRIATLSMQHPEAFTSLESLVGLVSRSVAQACPAVTAPADRSLSGLYDVLTQADLALGNEGRRLLLAIDEYEQLDEKIGAGVFPLDLLALLRESMQMHRRMTWIFAGSHDIAELKHAPWGSFLVSARTMEMPLFSEQETRLLLTEPLRYSALWQSNEQSRPHFSAEMWGEGGIAHIHAEAAGWPHLVQLIAETTIDLLNSSIDQHADRALREQAMDRAIVSGDIVLRQLLQQECTIAGEWDYICGFRGSDAQLPPGDVPVYDALRRRQIIVEDAGRWRLRVPLMQRWLRQRG